MAKDKKTIIVNDGLLYRYSGSAVHFDIPAGVSVIGDQAFRYCTKLESVTIPAGVEKIGHMAFANCRNLKRVILPDGLIEIDGSAFSECGSLESINIPDSLKKIGKYAFKNCRRLKLANVPDCLAKIGEGAFMGTDPQIKEAFTAAWKRNSSIYTACIVTITNLRRHTKTDKLQCTDIHGYNVIVDSACRIGQRMVYFPVGGELDEHFAKENHLLRGDALGNPTGYYVHPSRRRITGTSIRGEASEGLALPVEVLEKYTDIHSLKDGDRFSRLNGHQICSICLPEEMDIDLENKTLVRFFDKKRLPEKVYIPWGIETIGSEAFKNNRHMKEVIIPDTVNVIGKRAFYDCVSLKKIVVPDTVISIGDEAFAHCGGLASFRLPEHLKAFEHIYMNADDFIIEDGRLTKYKGEMLQVKIPEGFTEIGDGAFAGNCMIESVIIPKGLKRIGNRAFSGCRRLRRVGIPDSVTYIGYEAFHECRALRDITVPPSVEYIGEHAFGVYFFFRYIKGFKFPHEEYRKYKGFCMRCKHGSAAEIYAWKNNLHYSSSFL